MKIILFANTEWYLYNFRRSLAKALVEAGHDLLLVSPPGPYGEKLVQLGFRWVAAPMERRSLNPAREAILLYWLFKLIRKEQADLVHSFTIKCAVYGSLAARLAGSSARVNAVAGLGYVFTSNAVQARVLRPVVRCLLRIALSGRRTRLILQNPDDVRLFQRARLIHSDDIRLIPGSGVNCERFAPPRSARATGALRVVLPARLLWDKGVAEYVQAARQLLGAGRKIHFLLAGEPDSGNPAAVPEAAIQEWGRDGLIEWLGHVTDMPDLFHSVDIVVLPSYREGLPKGLIEAAACGLPLITTNVPGCREVVSDGIDGLLVPVRDGNALAQAIAKLQDDPGLRKELGRAARQKALQQFDERLIIHRTLQVYDELVPQEAHCP